MNRTPVRRRVVASLLAMAAAGAAGAWPVTHAPAAWLDDAGFAASALSGRVPGPVGAWRGGGVGAPPHGAAAGVLRAAAGPLDGEDGASDARMEPADDDPLFILLALDLEATGERPALAWERAPLSAVVPAADDRQAALFLQGSQVLNLPLLLPPAPRERAVLLVLSRLDAAPVARMRFDG
jgi:hypothetical protein